jgi:L-lactate dehydrogenase complex protein LldG
MITSKEKILKSIRDALIVKVPQPFPELEGKTKNVFAQLDDDLPFLFVEQFKKLGGHFTFCEHKAQLFDELNGLIQTKNWNKVVCWEHPLVDELTQENVQKITDDAQCEDMDASITYCEQLIARTGTVLLTSQQAAGRTLGAYAPVHIVVASISQLVNDVKDALNNLQLKYNNQLPSMICFTTGPSRTADIEKTLVVGVHGPKEIYVFLLDE